LNGADPNDSEESGDSSNDELPQAQDQIECNLEFCSQTEAENFYRRLAEGFKRYSEKLKSNKWQKYNKHNSNICQTLKSHVKKIKQTTTHLRTLGYPYIVSFFGQNNQEQKKSMHGSG
jgi:hypothetical protein